MENKVAPRGVKRRHEAEIGDTNSSRFLRSWFLDHIDDPFPTKSEENELMMKMNAQSKELESEGKPFSSPASSIGISQCQLWFINAQRESTWTEFHREYAFSNKSTMTELVTILKVESENTIEMTKSLARLWSCGKNSETRESFGDSLKERVAKCRAHWLKIVYWFEQSQHVDTALPENAKPSRKDVRRFSEETLSILLNEYEKNPHYENHIDRDRIAKKTGLKPRQVTVWFQNRRSRSENPPLKESTEKRRKRKRETLMEEPNKNSSVFIKRSLGKKRDVPLSLPVYDDDVVSRIDRDVAQLKSLHKELPSSSSSSQTQSPGKYLLESAPLPQLQTADLNPSFPALPSQDISLSEVYPAWSPLTYLDPFMEGWDDPTNWLNLQDMLSSWPSSHDLAYNVNLAGMFM